MREQELVLCLKFFDTHTHTHTQQTHTHTLSITHSISFHQEEPLSLSVAKG